MAEQLILPRRILDANGDTLSGAKLYAYIEGTTTLENIYSDEALTQLHSSPLVADSGGNFPPIWHAGDHGVKIRIDDASDVELSWSPLDPCPMTSSATTAENITFSPTSGNPASNVQDAIENVSNLGRPISEKGANYTALSTDRGTVLRATAAITISLTTASVLGDGWFVDIKADGGSVTIAPDGSEAIDETTVKNGSSLRVHCTGTEFYTTAYTQEGFISSTTLSNDATSDHTLDAAYDVHQFDLIDVIPASDGSTLEVRFSTDGGSSFDSGGSDYARGAVTNTGSGADASASSIDISGLGVGSGSNENGVSGRLTVYAPADATYTRLTCVLTYTDAVGTGRVSTAFGTRLTTTPVDAIRFFFSSGNLESGRIIHTAIKGA